MLKEVSVYPESSIRGRWDRDGYIGYVLEYYPDGSRLPGILRDYEQVVGMNENRSQVEALIRALTRIREKCILSVYTESEYLYSGFAGGELVKHWKANGWMTSRGTAVKNRDRWERAQELLCGNLCRFYLKRRNAYTDEIREDLRRLAAGEVTLQALRAGVRKGNAERREDGSG